MISARKVSRFCESFLLWFAAITVVLGGGYVGLIICIFGPLAWPVAGLWFLGCFFILLLVIRRMQWRNHLYDHDA
jgi:membrane protein implicated in regulation of membrane protease activity